MPLLDATGPPKIITPAGEEIILPLPHSSSFMKGDYLNETGYVQNVNRVTRGAGAKQIRPVFRFGYDILDASIAADLVRVFEEYPLFTFIPRTVSASDPATAAERSFSCRFTSDVPFVMPLKGNYSIDISLEAQQGSASLIVGSGTVYYSQIGGADGIGAGKIGVHAVNNGLPVDGDFAEVFDFESVFAVQPRLLAIDYENQRLIVSSQTKLYYVDLDGGGSGLIWAGDSRNIVGVGVDVAYGKILVCTGQTIINFDDTVYTMNLDGSQVTPLIQSVGEPVFFDIDVRTQDLILYWDQAIAFQAVRNTYDPLGTQEKLADGGILPLTTHHATLNAVGGDWWYGDTASNNITRMNFGDTATQTAWQSLSQHNQLHYSAVDDRLFAAGSELVSWPASSAFATPRLEYGVSDPGDTASFYGVAVYQPQS